MASSQPLKSAALTAYKRSYVKKDKPDAHIDVFRQINATFGDDDDDKTNGVLYPGCHRHLSASLVWPKVDYVDSDRKVANVYEDDACRQWVTENSDYETAPEYTFTCADFTQPLPPKFSTGTYHCLISLSAGIVSTTCVPYLIPATGLLVVNDSHSDARTAFLDDRLELVGAVVHDGGEDAWKVVTSPEQLDRYFRTKSDGNPTITAAQVEESIRIGSVAKRSFRMLEKEAFVYIFRRRGGEGDESSREAKAEATEPKDDEGTKKRSKNGDEPKAKKSKHTQG